MITLGSVMDQNGELSDFLEVVVDYGICSPTDSVENAIEKMKKDSRLKKYGGTLARAIDRLENYAY